MRNGKNIVEDGSQESDRASTASDEHDFRVESSTDPPAPHILSSHDEGSVKPGRSSPRPRPSPGHVSPLPAHESKSRKRRLPHAEADTIDLEAHSGPSPESSIMVSLDAKAMSTGTDSREEVPTINNGEQEDFPELARLARERARRRRHEEDMSSRPKAVSDVDVTSSAFSYSPDSRTMQSKSSTITMQILVTSTIAGTQPLIVTRTFSQRLKEVRLAWIRHQQLKNDQLDRAFLTYRGRRVFDVVSCKDLGVIAAPSGEDSKSHEACHVHMVVMTREGFDAHRQSRERQHDSGPDSDHEADDKPEPIVQEEAQIRITLQSRHYSDFKLIVKPVGDTVVPQKWTHADTEPVNLYFEGHQCLSHFEWPQDEARSQAAI